MILPLPLPHLREGNLSSTRYFDAGRYPSYRFSCPHHSRAQEMNHTIVRSRLQIKTWRTPIHWEIRQGQFRTPGQPGVEGVNGYTTGEASGLWLIVLRFIPASLIFPWFG